MNIVNKFVQLTIPSQSMFDLNKYMLRLGLIDGYYDGNQIKSKRRWHLYQTLILTILLFSIIRFVITFIYPKEHLIQIYLADMFNFLPYTSRMFLMATGTLFVIWGTCVTVGFHQMNRHPELTTWMRLMPMPQPLQPYTFAAYPNEMRVRFIKNTSIWLYRLNGVMIGTGFTIINVIYFKYLFLVSSLPLWQVVPLVFFHICTVNVYANQMILVLIVLSSCMSMLCQLLSQRYAHLHDRFDKLAKISQYCYLSHRPASASNGQPVLSEINTSSNADDRHCCVNLPKLDRLIVCFNQLSMEVMQINRFWCRIVFINNIFGLLLIVVGLFASVYSESPYMVVPVSSLMLYFYFIVFFYQIALAGEIFIQV